MTRTEAVCGDASYGTLFQYETRGKIADTGRNNRKPCRRTSEGLFPFVRLIEAAGTVYPEASRLLERVAAEFETVERIRFERIGGMSQRTVEGSTRIRTIESFRGNPAYDGDNTCIDLAYAIYSLAHGIPEADVRAAIVSRDLSHKGTARRQVEYVDRTLQKAYELIEHERGRAVGR